MRLPREYYRWVNGNAYPLKELTREGMDAFDELCRLGCEREEIAKALDLMHFSVASPTGLDKPEAQLLRVAHVAKAPAGSDWWWKIKNADKAEIEVLDYDKRKAIEKLSMDLLEAVRDFQKTVLWGWMRGEPNVNPMHSANSSPTFDLLFARHVEMERAFQSLVNLNKIVAGAWKQVGPKAKPVFNATLTRLIHHVRQKTGRPRFRLLADLLNSLHVSETTWTEDLLKAWAVTHGPKNRHASR